ncbi:hypothetical protein ACB092_04G183700 [Castanea dentata]
MEGDQNSNTTGRSAAGRGPQISKGFRLNCLFRFKIWWMIPSFGTAGCDVPIRTQFLLLEARDKSSIHDENSKTTSENTFYILFLPVLDGLFRTTLQGTSANELDFCVESGDPDVQTSLVTEAIFINSADNPFKLFRDSIKILEKHKGTVSHIENKKLPAHLDWFGWNTWDAFYANVSAEAIEDGLRSFSEGGCPPKCLFIDDGWQNTACEDDEQFTEDTNFVFRLVNLKENAKFKGEKPCVNLHHFVKSVKEKYGLK